MPITEFNPILPFFYITRVEGKQTPDINVQGGTVHAQILETI